MKKVITLILAMLMLLTVGCGTQSDTTDSSNEGTTTVSNAQASTETKATTAAPNTASSDIPAEVNDEQAIYQALQEYYDVVMAEDRAKLEEIVFLQSDQLSKKDKGIRKGELNTIIKSQKRNKYIYQLAGMELLLPIQPFTEKYGKETYRTQVVYLQRAFKTDDNGEKILVYKALDEKYSDFYDEMTNVTTANMVYDKEKGKWFFSDKGEIVIFSYDHRISRAEWDKYKFVEEDKGGWIAIYADKMLELNPFGTDLEKSHFSDLHIEGKYEKVNKQ